MNKEEIDRLVEELKDNDILYCNSCEELFAVDKYSKDWSRCPLCDRTLYWVEEGFVPSYIKVGE